jgi:hypothetical protein
LSLALRGSSYLRWCEADGVRRTGMSRRNAGEEEYVKLRGTYIYIYI